MCNAPPMDKNINIQLSLGVFFLFFCPQTPDSANQACHSRRDKMLNSVKSMGIVL